MLKKYVQEIPKIIEKIINKKNQKPTTIIYPNPKNLPGILTKTNSIAIRITTDLICSEIIKKLQKPIISTSANISNEENPKNFREINNEIKKMVDYIVKEKTNLNLTNPSRIIKINPNKSIEIIRE